MSEKNKETNQTKNGLPWAEEEKECLRQACENNISDADIADKLGRKIKSIRYMMEKLCCSERYRKWTDEERNYVLSNYGKLSAKEISQKLNRPRTSVMGVIKNWGQDELDYLKQAYLEHIPTREIAKKIKRTYRAVQAKASELGYVRHVKKWTEEEKNYIRENYKKIPVKEIVAKLDRPLRSVYVKADLLGCSERERGADWSDEEKQYLKENYGKIAIKELRKTLNRTKSAIISKANILECSQKTLPWDGEDKILLHYLYSRQIKGKEIAQILGRTLESIRTAARLFGYARKEWREKWTNDEMDYVRRAYERHEPVEEIAHKLGRTRNAISGAVKTLNCSNMRRWTKSDEDYLRKAYAEHIHVSDIAQKLGVTSSAVTGKAHELGCSMGQLGFTDYTRFVVGFVYNPFTKQEEYLASSWERNFFDWCVKNDVYVTKSHRIKIIYVDGDGEKHQYWPDFLLNKQGLLVETKGYPDKNLPYKIVAAQKYCEENNLTYILIPEGKNFEKYIDLGN